MCCSEVTSPPTPSPHLPLQTHAAALLGSRQTDYRWPLSGKWPRRSRARETVAFRDVDMLLINESCERQRWEYWKSGHSFSARVRGRCKQGWWGGREGQLGVRRWKWGVFWRSATTASRWKRADPVVTVGGKMLRGESGAQVEVRLTLAAILPSTRKSGKALQLFNGTLYLGRR